MIVACVAMRQMGCDRSAMVCIARAGHGAGPILHLIRRGGLTISCSCLALLARFYFSRLGPCARLPRCVLPSGQRRRSPYRHACMRANVRVGGDGGRTARDEEGNLHVLSAMSLGQCMHAPLLSKCHVHLLPVLWVTFAGLGRAAWSIRCTCACLLWSEPGLLVLL